MFENIRELCKYIVLLNSDGMKLLIESVKDISSCKRYRKSERVMSDAQYRRSIDTVLEMVHRNYIKENEQCRNM